MLHLPIKPGRIILPAVVDVLNDGFVVDDELEIKGSFADALEKFVAPCEFLSEEEDALFSRLFMTKLSFEPSVNL